MKAALCFDEIRAALPAATGELLTRVARRAARRGDALELVGGPVRDLLLGRPLNDVDLRVQGDARALAEAVAGGRGGGELEVIAHDRFGTVRLASPDAGLDLATCRQETYAQPGALPTVEAGSALEDAQRRDFSVNALACPLDVGSPDAAQPILDPQGGLEDLAAKRLRILHARSFHDDPTRAWRAARFAVRLGFTLDRGSRNALRNALRDGAFGAVSGERFRRELQLAFDEAQQGIHVGRILRLLSDWHVLAALEPGLSLPRDRMIPLRRLSKAIAEPEWPAPRWRGWIAGLSIWLAPLPAAQRRRTLDRFSIRGEQAARIVRFGRDAERTLRTLARARGRGAVDAVLVDLPEETVQGLYALADVPVRRRILRWGAEDRRRRAPVTGDELVALGLSGRDVGRALERIRAGFLDGEIANREEALALAEELARRASRRGGRGAKARKKRRGVAGGRAITDTPGGRRGSGPPRHDTPRPGRGARRGRSATRRGDDTSGDPAEQSAEESATHSVEQSAEQSAEQSVEQSAEVPVDLPKAPHEAPADETEPPDAP